MVFLSSIKLHYSRTIVLLKKLFQKRRWSCDFPPRKTPVAQKHRAIFRQEKVAFSTPVGLSWDSPPPPAESVGTDGRTDGHVTITSQPKFLESIGYPAGGLCLQAPLWWYVWRCGTGALQVFILPTMSRAPCLAALNRRLGTRQWCSNFIYLLWSSNFLGQPILRKCLRQKNSIV